MRSRRPILVLLLLVGVLLTACGGDDAGGGANKAGADAPPPPVVVTLALPDAADADARFFADAVRDRSHGTLEVHVDGDTYSSMDPHKEAQLTGALKGGDAQLGFLAARNWAAAGAPAFVALQAPFVVTSSAASAALAKSPVAARIVSSLDAQGVVGLGLVAHEPRRILSRRPILQASDLDAMRIRVFDEPHTAALVEALGAVPVQGLTARAAGDALQQGTIDGVETSPEYIRTNAYATSAPYLSAFALVPKFQTIVASEAWWDTLDAEQQDALRQAVADTVAHADDTAQREQDELAELCQRGVVLTRPSQVELAVMATAAAGSDAATAGTSVDWLTSIREAAPPAIRQALDVPAGCTIATTAAEALAAREPAATSAATSAAPAEPFPDGTFETTTTVEDLQAGGQFGDDWSKDITWTFRFHDGKVHSSQKPAYPDQPECDGDYTTDGDLLTIVWEEHCGIDTEVTRWSYYDGQLSFEVVSVSDTAGRVLYSAHPWRRVD